MGCCDAWAASCAGSINGKPFSWDDYDEDAPDFDEDTIIDRIERHHWYTDTGQPAPADGGPLPCRCESQTAR